MTTSRSSIIIGIMAVIIVLLLWTVVWFGRDEYQELAREHGDTIGTQNSRDEKIAPGKLRLDTAAQRAGGILTAKAASTESRATLEVQALIVDVRPLIDARGRYLAQQAEARALRAAASASEIEYRRMSELFKDERNVSERTMLAAEAQWKTDKARLNSAEQASQSQLEAMRAQWGATLTQLAVGSGGFGGFAAQSEFVAEVSIPFEQDRTVVKSGITLEPAGGGKAVTARFLSAAPSTSSGAGAATYFYRVPASGFRIGMRAIGRVPLGSGSGEKGVKVPDGAVIWHAGRAWVYLRTAAEVFQRVPLDTSRQVAGGWFAGDDIAPEAEVVVTGAQLLLSEELKYQIRNENED